MISVIKPFIKPVGKFVLTNFGPEAIKWSKKQLFGKPMSAEDYRAKAEAERAKAEYEREKAARKAAEIKAKALVKAAEETVKTMK